MNLLDNAINNKDSYLAMRTSNQITFLVVKMNKNFPEKITSSLKDTRGYD